MRAPTTKCKAPPGSFFKFIPSLNNSHLSIPKSFRKYLKGGRKNNVAILKRGNQRWLVKIVDDWVFGEGWDKFTQENGVKDFDIVIFKHEGNMVFDTMVFDPSWCEREYSTDLVTKSFPKSSKKIQRANNIYYSKRSPLKAKKLATSDQSRHPYFVGIVKQYVATKECLYVPKIFALENGLSNGEMILKDVEYEGSWAVNLNYSGKKFCIQRGFSEFCTAIGLETGNSLRFELIQKGKKPVAIVSRLPEVALSNPYFRSTVTAYSIKRASLNIPLSFARSNKWMKSKGCEMVVMDEKQRLWPTKLCCPGDHVCIRELQDMLVANELKEGDEILFELVKNEEKPLMKLHDLSKVSPNGEVVQSIFQAIPRRPRAPDPSLNLSFKSTATACSMKYYHVKVPLRFARANGLFGKNCELAVMDEKQRLWPTRLGCGGGHVYISRIRDMWVANGLKKGDEFLLKLVDNGKKPQMTLHICRQVFEKKKGDCCMYWN